MVHGRLWLIGERMLDGGCWVEKCSVVAYGLFVVVCVSWYLVEIGRKEGFRWWLGVGND